MKGFPLKPFHFLSPGKPTGVDYDDAKRRLVEIDGVEGVHSLRIWSLTSDVPLVCVHLILGENINII